MLKTISAALLGAVIVAAPVLAATPARNAPAPAKTTQAPAAKITAQKTTQAPVIKADRAKSKVMNANARMHRHHTKHHRHYKKNVLKTQQHTPKVAIKHVAPAKPAKRG
jgi:hypothetical protein